MHIVKVSKVGEFTLVQKYTAFNYGGAGKKRKKRAKVTSEYNKKYNNKLRADELQLLILGNFRKGYHLVLGYPKGNDKCTYRESDDNLKRFLDRVRRRCKKEGKEFKFLAVTERGKRKEALHHHMIIPGDPELLAIIQEQWDSRHIHISTMYEEGAYRDLAEYFVKVETKEEAEKGKAKYHRSRNLRKPEVRKMISNEKMPKEPVIPKGCELVKDSFVQGFHEGLGIRYQRYMVRDMRPCPHKQKPKKKKTGLRGILSRLFGGRHAP